MKIAILMLWEAGHLLPTFRIAGDLVRCGHEVTYLTVADLVDLPRSRGFNAQAVLDDVFPPTVQTLGHPCSPDQQSSAGALLRRRLQEGVLERRLMDLEPDIVLVDVLFASSVGRTLQGRGLRVLAVGTSLPDEPDGWLPPITSALPPSRTLRNRAAIGLAWSGVLIERWLTRFSSKAVLPAGRGPRLPTIVLCSAALDFPRPVSDTRCYVGPCVEIDRPAQAFAWSDLRLDRKLVYCSLGTQAHRYAQRLRLIRSVMDATDAATEQLLIVADATALRELGKLRSGVIAVTHAPQIELLRRAALAITHGGLGTVKECVLLGVPMMIAPQAFDQIGNAARVTHHGIGCRTSNEPRASELRGLMNEVSCGKYIERIRRMQRIFEAEQQTSLVAELVDLLCARPASSSMAMMAAFVRQRASMRGCRPLLK